MVREFLGLSYRGTEAVLADTNWCARLGTASVPDHSTLCRAFAKVAAAAAAGRLMDLCADAMRAGGRPSWAWAPTRGRT